MGPNLPFASPTHDVDKPHRDWRPSHRDSTFRAQHDMGVLRTLNSTESFRQGLPFDRVCMTLVDRSRRRNPYVWGDRTNAVGALDLSFPVQKEQRAGRTCAGKD